MNRRLAAVVVLIAMLGVTVAAAAGTLHLPLISRPASPTPSPTPLPLFDGEAAYRHVPAQLEMGPRDTGSEGNRQLGDYILAELERHGWQTEEQPFTYRGVSGRNLIGKAGEGPIALIGAHYDTRRQADRDPDPARRQDPVPGGNDGASGVAVLLELARVLDRSRLSHQVWLVFFDAEDNGGLDGWDFIAGSTYMAANLIEVPEFVIIVDMIGDADQQLYKERNSTAELQDRIWDLAGDMGYGDYFIPQYKWSILDDHTPFLMRGIPAVDIIDFDYPYWHTVEDTADKVAPASLERVGRVVQAFLEGGMER